MWSPLPVRRPNCSVPMGAAQSYWFFLFTFLLFISLKISFIATLVHVSHIYTFKDLKSV